LNSANGANVKDKHVNAVKNTVAGDLTNFIHPSDSSILMLAIELTPSIN
jgi:hypothetical protein